MEPIEIDMEAARQMLGLTQEELATALGWTGPRQVNAIENGKKTQTIQTDLALECLLRREGLWEQYLNDD